jgi:hypothetical protein
MGAAFGDGVMAFSGPPLFYAKLESAPLAV